MLEAYVEGDWVNGGVIGQVPFHPAEVAGASQELLKSRGNFSLASPCRSYHTTLHFVPRPASNHDRRN